MAESDAEFVERMAQIYGPYKLTREPQLAHLITLARRGAEAAARIEQLEKALREGVYEATHLSPENEDGSHWAKMSKAWLEQARAALGEKA